MDNPYLFFKTNNKNLVLPEFFNILPPEIFEKLLAYLKIKDLQTLCRTSKALQQRINSSITSSAKFSDPILASAIKHAFTPIVNIQIIDNLLTQTEFNRNSLTTRENFLIVQKLLNNKLNRNIRYSPKVTLIPLSEIFKVVGALSGLATLALIVLFNADNIQLKSFSIFIIALTIVTIINQIKAFHENISNLNTELVSLRNKIHSQDKNYYSLWPSQNHQKHLLETFQYLYPSIQFSINKDRLVTPIEYTKQILSMHLQDVFNKFNIKNNDLYQYILEELDQSLEFKKIASLQIS